MVPLCLLLALEALAVSLVDEYTERNLFTASISPTKLDEQTFVDFQLVPS